MNGILDIADRVDGRVLELATDALVNNSVTARTAAAQWAIIAAALRDIAKKTEPGAERPEGV